MVWNPEKNWIFTENINAFSTEKAVQVIDFYVLESNWCFCGPPGSQAYIASPNLQSPDAQAWYDKLIKAIQFNIHNLSPESTHLHR